MLLTNAIGGIKLLVNERDFEHAVAFINEIADLCEKTGANIRDVARGVGLDNRIGSKFLQAGPGYGGSCFPKDTLALQQMARSAGAPSQLIEATIKSNNDRKYIF